MISSKLLGFRVAKSLKKRGSRQDEKRRVLSRRRSPPVLSKIGHILRLLGLRQVPISVKRGVTLGLDAMAGCCRLQECASTTKFRWLCGGDFLGVANEMMAIVPKTRANRIAGANRVGHTLPSGP
jgi:hypothetical protein